MDYITGAITLLSMLLIRAHRWEGWLVGLVNQVFWAILIYTRELWGLVPVTVALTIIYTSAIISWRKQHIVIQRS